MRYTDMLREKEAFIAEVLANPSMRFKRDDPDKLSELKNKTLVTARLNIRTEAVDGGGAVPDDEMQCDVIISNNEVDGHGSIMTEKTLRNYAEDAEKGVPFMREHGSELNQMLGRTVYATYDEAEKHVVATVSMLRDTDDTPENMRINEYLRRIERKYYDSASVGFRDATETCNICGKEIFDFYRDDPCPHVPKKVYEGVVCTYNVDDARLREVSLVPTGSNAGAKFLDMRNWTDEMRNVKKEGDTGSPGTNDPKSILERDGEKYRATLIDTAIKAGIRAEDDFDEAAWKKRFETRDADEIIAQTETWNKLGDARWGEGGRKTTDNPGAGPAGDPNNQPLILPSYLFEL